MVMTLLTRPKKTVATVVIATDGSGDFNTDGTADDVEINAALNSLPATGGCIYMKEGVYTITASMIFPNNNIALLGCGKSTEIATTQNIPMISVTNLSGILITNLFLQGASGGANNDGIYFDTVIDSKIESCWFEDCEDSIALTGSNNNTISRNSCISSTDDGIVLIGGSAGNNIMGNICEDNGGVGISAGESDNIIIGNTCHANDQDGIQLGFCSSAVVEGNFCYENEHHGIYLNRNCENIVISGNVCVDNDFSNTTTYDGINIDTSSNYNIIANNRCQDNDRYEINIVVNTCNSNIIIGNICIGTDHVGAINDAGTNTHPNGASGTTNLQLDDLNILT